MVMIKKGQIELHYEKSELLPEKDWIDSEVPIVVQNLDPRSELLIEREKDKAITITVAGLKLTLGRQDFYKAFCDYLGGD